MTKTKTPFFSMGSSGTLGRAITSQKRGAASLLRTKPTPADPYSLPQAYQRWLYQDYCAEWSALSDADKQTWKSAASRFHMPGMAYFLRNRLTALADIAGGWHLDSITGSSVIDFSKNLNHGTVYGATLVDGIIDHALSFDGVDDGVNCGNAPSLNITADLHFTWECFSFVRGSLTTYGTLMSLAPWDYPRFYHHPVAKKLIAFVNFQVSGQLYLASSVVPINQWNHCALTWDGQYVRIYANGIVVATSADLTGDTLVPYSSDFWLGKVNTYRLEGVLDQAIFYKRALTLSDIKRHSLRRYPV